MVKLNQINYGSNSQLIIEFQHLKVRIYRKEQIKNTFLFIYF